MSKGIFLLLQKNINITDVPGVNKFGRTFHSCIRVTIFFRRLEVCTYTTSYFEPSKRFLCKLKFYGTDMLIGY